MIWETLPTTRMTTGHLQTFKILRKHFTESRYEKKNETHWVRSGIFIKTIYRDYFTCQPTVGGHDTHEPLTSGSGEGTLRLPSHPEKPADGYRLPELGDMRDTARVGSWRRYTVPAHNIDWQHKEKFQRLARSLASQSVWWVEGSAYVNWRESQSLWGIAFRSTKHQRDPVMLI